MVVGPGTPGHARGGEALEGLARRQTGCAGICPRRQSADAGPGRGRASIFSNLSWTPRSPPTWSTRPATSTCSKTWPLATPASSCAAAGTTPAGQLDLAGSARTRRCWPAGGPAAVARLVGPLSAALAPGACRGCTTRWSARWCRVLARMEESGVRVDTASCSRLARELADEAQRSRPRSRSWPATRSSSTRRPAAAGGAVQQARPDAGEEDQDRLLH